MALTFNLLTTSELSTLLKRAPETLVRWRRTRVGPPFLVVEGRVLYDEAEVKQWIDSRRTHAKPPRAHKPNKATNPPPAALPRTLGFRFSPDYDCGLQTPEANDS